MSKSVIINLSGGDLLHGFPHITAQLLTPGHPLPEQFSGRLPAAPHLLDRYHTWQSLYRSPCDRKPLRAPNHDLEIDPGGITNVSHQSFIQLSIQLQEQFNDWLRSPSFLHLDRALRSHPNSITHLQAIPPTDPNHATAQQKIDEYQQNLRYAQQQP